MPQNSLPSPLKTLKILKAPADRSPYPQPCRVHDSPSRSSNDILAEKSPLKKAFEEFNAMGASMLGRGRDLDFVSPSSSSNKQLIRKSELMKNTESKSPVEENEIIDILENSVPNAPPPAIVGKDCIETTEVGGKDGNDETGQLSAMEKYKQYVSQKSKDEERHRENLEEICKLDVKVWLDLNCIETTI